MKTVMLSHRLSIRTSLGAYALCTKALFDRYVPIVLKKS